MLRGGRTVLLEGQTEHVDVGVLSTLGMPKCSNFRLRTLLRWAFTHSSAMGIITLGVFRKASSYMLILTVLMNAADPNPCCLFFVCNALILLRWK